MTPQPPTVIAMTYRDDAERNGEQTLTNRLAEFAKALEAKPTTGRKDEEVDWDRLDGYF